MPQSIAPVTTYVSCANAALPSSGSPATANANAESVLAARFTIPFGKLRPSDIGAGMPPRREPSAHLAQHAPNSNDFRGKEKVISPDIVHPLHSYTASGVTIL